MNSKKHSTQCVHAGMTHDELAHGVNSPIYPSSAFPYRHKEKVAYPRYYNTKNQEIVSKKIALLEKGEEGLLFSSGMAAITSTLLSLLKDGDHAVFFSELYGGTYNLIQTEFVKRNISFTLVEENNLDAFEKSIQKNTKLIYIESPTNPLLTIVDISGIAKIARKHDCISMIDNTFASPINQNPITFGIDIVAHSGTKYLGGHSDLSFGAIVTNSKLMPTILDTAINYGGNINALDAYLIERSLKTLSIRVKQQNENALDIAHFLSNLSDIKSVYYPGLPTHANHHLALEQMTGFGGMLSFELKAGGYLEAGRFLDSLEIIQAAVSLGGVETMVCSPIDTSHAKMPKEIREKYGISDSLIRMSVGIEDVEDLKNDIIKALATLKEPALSIT